MSQKKPHANIVHIRIGKKITIKMLKRKKKENQTPLTAHTGPALRTQSRALMSDHKSLQTHSTF